MPRRRTLIMLGAVALIAAVVLGVQLLKASMFRRYALDQSAEPQTVATVIAVSHPWTSTFEAVGTLRAARGAELASELAGIVDRISFRSGADVDVGAPILELNTDADRAQLSVLEAAAELAASVLARDRAQFEIKAVSQATLDADIAAARSTAAQVAQQRALMAKKVIRAPFAGRLGLRAVDVGQYIAPGTRIVTLQSLDSLYVDFSVPQSVLPDIAVGAKVQVRSNADPAHLYTGTIEATDAVIDVSTRNATVRARLENPRRTLLPGGFARVTVVRGRPVSYVTLPQTAVTFNPYGSTVYTVERGDAPNPGAARLVARQRFVRTGPTRGDQVAVLGGLAAGTEVVAAGQMKLRNGTRIAIDNSTVPTNDATPTVVDR